jgi:hypothetical protein
MASGPIGGPPQGTTQIVVPGTGWVDVFSRVIVQVGFPVVVAGVLLWFLLTRFQDNMNNIVARMSNNTVVVERLIGAEATTVEELKKQTLLLQQIATDGKELADIRTRELEQLQAIAKQMERARP